MKKFTSFTFIACSLLAQSQASQVSHVKSKFCLSFLEDLVSQPTSHSFAQVSPLKRRAYRGASGAADVETTWMMPKSLKNAKWGASKMQLPMEGLVGLSGLVELMSYSCVELSVRKMRRMSLKRR